MTVETRASVKSKYESGDKPTELDFIDAFDSVAFLVENNSFTTAQSFTKIDVSGSADFGDVVNVSGTATFGSQVTINADVIANADVKVSGDVSAKDLSLTGTLTVVGSAIISGDFFVGGSFSVPDLATGTVSASAIFSDTGRIAVTTVSASSIWAADQVIIAGNTAATENNVAVTQVFTGSTSWVSGATNVFTHGLGAVPTYTVVSFVCISADNGFDVGEELRVDGVILQGGTFDVGYMLIESTTETKVRCMPNGVLGFVSAGAKFNLAANAYHLRVRSYV